MGLLEALGLRSADAAAAKSEPSVKIDPDHIPKGAVAQLVGATLISALNDPGFGTEKYLPKLLDAGPDGRRLKTFTSVSAGSGDYVPKGRYRFDENYLSQLTGSYSFLVNHYWEDVEGFNMFMWKGVHMDGLPVVTGFTAERTETEAKELWDYNYESFGLSSKPALTIVSGNSGWSTLEAGWKLIGPIDSKVIWQVTTDSPSYPKNEEPNEAAVLLIVANPVIDTGRSPLVYFTAPQVVSVKEAIKQRKEEPSRVAALRQSVVQVCAAAGIEPGTIGSLVTDCGRGNPAAGTRLSEVGAALHELLPKIDVVHDRIDMVALLGELGANTVNYSLLLGAFAAYTRNHPVLYLSNVDPEAGRAMLILPPIGHTPPDPNRTFREHSPRGQWYSPWWGQRLDGKKDY